MNSKAALQNNSKSEEEEKNKLVEKLKLTYPNGLAGGPSKDKSNHFEEESFSSFGGAKLDPNNGKETLTLMEKRSLMKQGTHFGKPTESNSDEMSPKVNKDVEVVETHNTNRKISDEEIKNAPVLLLEELTGEVLKNNKLKINAGGLTTGLRKAKDGVAFFGKVTLLFLTALFFIYLFNI